MKNKQRFRMVGRNHVDFFRMVKDTAILGQVFANMTIQSFLTKKGNYVFISRHALTSQTAFIIILKDRESLVGNKTEGKLEEFVILLRMEELVSSQSALSSIQLAEIVWVFLGRNLTNLHW